MALEMRGKYWFFRKMINGIPFARSTKTADRKLAEAIAATWEADAIKSVMIAGTKPVKLKEAVSAFLLARKGTGGYANAKLHLSYYQNGIPNKPMNEIAEYEALSVVNQRREAGASHNTVAVSIMYWNALQNFCTRSKFTAGPKLQPVAQQATRIRYLTKDEEDRLFESIDPEAKYRGKNPINDARRADNTDLLICLLDLGARLNEVQKMKKSQINFQNNTVYVLRSKRGVDNHVVMTTRLRTVLERRCRVVEGESVFPTKDKEKVNTNWIRKAVRRAGITEDIGKVTLHCCRHTAATRLLQGGLSIIETQQFLGHKNTQSTMVYLHAVPTASAQRAAQILDQD